MCIRDRVVTTLLIATKRNISDPIDLDRRISFCTLKEKLENIADIKKLSREIILNKESDWVNIQSYSCLLYTSDAADE